MTPCIGCESTDHCRLYVMIGAEALELSIIINISFLSLITAAREAGQFRASYSHRTHRCLKCATRVSECVQTKDKRSDVKEGDLHCQP